MRKKKKEADDFALEQMDRFGIPVDHFAAVMGRLGGFYLNKNDAAETETLQQEKSIADFFSTHPTTKERIKLVDQFKANHP
ncbi:MAG: M48 family metalloprotease [Gammaproteobacteria bacterium]|nr:M48 family metalloprotease [Gammaproteobacteria bacterium]MCF6231413.1 M48 family metalloprotease [Gammaproteobacteria bacterium]